ncbi:unnamed protein product, partial [Dovyalis caffra]
MSKARSNSLAQPHLSRIPVLEPPRLSPSVPCPDLVTEVNPLLPPMASHPQLEAGTHTYDTPTRKDSGFSSSLGRANGEIY